MSSQADLYARELVEEIARLIERATAGYTVGGRLNYAAGAGGGGAGRVPKANMAPLGTGDLSDVDVTTAPPADGAALVWDAATLKWVPGPAGSGGGSALAVREADGTPADAAATALVFPNGMIQDITAHVVTLRLRGLSPLTTQDDVIVADAAGAEARLAKGGTAQTLGVTGAGHVGYFYDERTVSIPIGNGVDPLVPGVKNRLELPWDGTIVQWTLVNDAGVATSVVVDLWVDRFANYPPTAADSITGTTPPTLTGAVTARQNVLTGWTADFQKGDWLLANVNSVGGTPTSLTLALLVRRRGTS